MKIMKKSLVILTALSAAACSPKQTAVRGTVTDATMNTVTIVSTPGDTLSFSTVDAVREIPDGLLLNDTATIYFTGKYTSGKAADKIVVEARHAIMTGADRDEHGCIGSAGYTWSEVRQNCIRLFETGVRVEAVDGNETAYIVFSQDSTRVELFFSDTENTEILERRTLPSGGYAWNVEDDDTKNVTLDDGEWTISRRGKIIYRQGKTK